VTVTIMVLVKMMDDDSGASMRTIKKYFTESLSNNTAFKRIYSDVYCMFLHIRKHGHQLSLLNINSYTDVNQQGLYSVSTMFRVLIFKMP
jgi:hypothetical protein